MSEFASEWIDHDMIYTSYRAWRERLGRYRLAGSKCRSCGQIWFPKRHGVCGKCNSQDLADYECPHEGVVAEYTVWDTPYTSLNGTQLFGAGNRVVAMIRLDDGLHVWSDLEDCDPKKVKVGMRVRMVVRKWMRESNGNWLYGYRFVPE